MIATHGKWDPSEDVLVFAPGNPCDERDPAVDPQYLPMHRTIRYGVNRLISAYAIQAPGELALFDATLGWHRHVFLDSGVFTLAMMHAKAHGLSHNEALKTPVEKIDGWNDFLEFYCAICEERKYKLWGYVELDLGGTEQKIKTRAELERRGLRPIPVWHPLQDGIEYGEYLMSRYDRICLGNLVKSDEATRHIVMRTMLHVKQKYPRCWVHALGLSMHPMAVAYRINSLDAITWMLPVMYNKRITYAFLDRFQWESDRLYGDGPDDYGFAAATIMMQIRQNEQNWRSYRHALRQAFADNRDLGNGSVDRIPPMARGAQGKLSRESSPARFQVEGLDSGGPCESRERVF